MNKAILWLLVAVAACGLAAAVKVSELPSASSVNATNVLPMVVGGQTVKATVGQLGDAIIARTNGNARFAGLESMDVIPASQSPYTYRVIGGLGVFTNGCQSSPDGFYGPVDHWGWTAWPSNVLVGYNITYGVISSCATNFDGGSGMWAMYSDTNGVLTWSQVPRLNGFWGNWLTMPKYPYATNTLLGATRPDQGTWVLTEGGLELPTLQKFGYATKVAGRLVVEAGARIAKNLQVQGRVLLDRSRDDVAGADDPTLAVVGDVQADYFGGPAMGAYELSDWNDLVAVNAPGEGYEGEEFINFYDFNSTPTVQFNRTNGSATFNGTVAAAGGFILTNGANRFLLSVDATTNLVLTPIP